MCCSVLLPVLVGKRAPIGKCTRRGLRGQWGIVTLHTPTHISYLPQHRVIKGGDLSPKSDPNVHYGVAETL